MEQHSYTLTDGDLWALFRDMISQGTYIQMDYTAGKYKCYEEYSARLDAAARERLDQFIQQHRSAPTVSERK